MIKAQLVAAAALAYREDLAVVRRRCSFPQQNDLYDVDPSVELREVYPLVGFRVVGAENQPTRRARS